MLKFSKQDRSPIPVEIDGKALTLPRFERADWDAFRESIDRARMAQIGEGTMVGPRELAQLLLLYPLKPITRQEAYAYVYTQGGAAYIFRTCAQKAGADDGEIDEWLDALSDYDVETMAVMLASIVSPDEIARRMEEDRKREEAIKEARRKFDEAAKAAVAGRKVAGPGGGGQDDERFESANPQGFADESAEAEAAESEDPKDPLHRTAVA